MLSDDEGICFPSYSTIVAKIGIGETKVKNAIKHLTELGLITKKKRMKDNGSASSNLYVVCEKTALLVAEKSDDGVSRITSCVCLAACPVVRHKPQAVCQTTAINIQIIILNILIIIICHQ